MPSSIPLDTPESQPVLDPITEAAIFLVVTVDAGGDETVRQLLADLTGLKRSVGFRIPEAHLTLVTGIGSRLWDRLFAGPKPAGLHPFPGYTGAKHTAPATPGDLLFHMRARRLDLCFELATLITDRLAGVATVVDEVHGFRSFDERDLLGFVDGTENPEGREAFDAVVIGDEDAAFAGGSYAIVQKYVHDLAAWKSLSTGEQERVIGRTKADDIEMSDDVKPSNSHIALNVIEDENGDELQILRYNMPFGRVGEGEFGTYFIGYSSSPEVTEQMLTNMFIGKPTGNYDRVLDYSTALTGTLFFVPSLELLDDPPEPVGAAFAAPASPTDPEPQPAAPPEGSLGIGSLREQTT